MGDPTVSMAEYNKFIAEGQTFEQSANYQQAVECYTHGLECISVAGVLQDDIGKFCYCMRSRCNLLIGKHDEALEDAESALGIDKDLIKGIYAKAEALYFKGDFEFALLNYHVGNQMRPDLKNFKLGIQKAREAIDNAIGSTKRCTLKVEGDLDVYYQGLDIHKGKKRGNNRRKGTARSRSAKSAQITTEKTVKQLLGELYVDRAYLEALVQDPSLRLGKGSDVKSLASAGLQYLDKRTEFWRQQKPMYVRQQEKLEQTQRRKNSTSKISTKQEQRMKRRETIEEVRHQVEHALERALQAYEQKDIITCINYCDEVLNTIDEPQDMNEKEQYSIAIGFKGFCQFSQELYFDALEAHQKELSLVEDELDQARALCCIGRCHAILGETAEAISSWSRAKDLLLEDLSSAWLLHELGRSYLALGNFDEALDCAIAGLTFADSADNREWKLYLTILQAQAQESLGGRVDALQTYRSAMEQARSLYRREIAATLEEVCQNLRPYADVARSDLNASEGEEPHQINTASHDSIAPTLPNNDKDVTQHTNELQLSDIGLAS